MITTNVCSGSIADVRWPSQDTNMAPVFVEELMPWPVHFFPKTCGLLFQLIFRPIAHRRMVDGHVSMIARP